MARSVDIESKSTSLDVDLLPKWLPWAIFILSLVGIAISSYLVYAHFTTTAVLACPENGTINCAKVTTSAQSYFLGIPVSMLGLGFFIVYSIVNFPLFFSRRNLFYLRTAMSIASIAFVLWLVYAELLVINAICLWCSGVHIVTLAIFLGVLYSFSILKGSSRPA